MRKIIYLNFVIIILFSCQKNKKDLKLELLTNQIFCLENIEKNQFIEANYLPNKEYDNLSRNILNYRVTNISDKKYYIMLNKNSIGTLEHDYYNEAIGRKKTKILNSLSFSLYKNDSILDGISTKNENVCGTYNSIKQQDSFVTDFLIKNKLNRTR